MSLTSKLKIYGALASAAILLVPLGIWYEETQGGDADNYVLDMRWVPETLPRTNKVIITLTVDGFPLVDHLEKRQSPFHRTMTAAKGAVIVLTGVSTYEGTQKIDCIIMRNGRSVPHGGFDSMLGSGPVKCVA